MIDVNKITSTLAKLGDPELQQYAQMHKNDPYIMALAMSESNRRKELRAASQESMQEQPKVVDQMVAEMAPQQMPEDQGIGQLPAGDMNFANGGIIAFADGGDVERYQFGGLFETDPAKLRAMAEERLRLEQLRQGRLIASGPYSSLAASAPNTASTASSASFLRKLNPAGLAGYGFGLYHGDLNEGEEAELARRRAMPPTITDPKSAAPVAAGTEGRRTAPVAEGVGTNVSPNLVPASARAKAAADKPAANLNPAAPGGKPSAPAEDKSASGLDALVNKFTRSTDLAIGDQRNARAGLVAQLEQEATETKVEGEARRLARGNVFADKEARLAEREKGIAGLNDKYMGLALLQAGAAMMSTPGNLGSVIGKGIQVGSERYVAGIDKINAAKDKFAEARDRLDDLRINRDDMNEKEVRDENRAIRTARIQGQQLLLDGAGKDLEISNANQKAIFGVAAENILADKKIISAEKISKNEISARERIAQIPQGQERIASLLGKGDLAVGLAKFAEIQAGKFNPTTAYTDYISKRKEGDTVLTPQEFVTQIRSIQALMGKAPPTTVDTSKPDRQ